MAYQASKSDIPPGTRVGKYEIITQIASGGMANVYLAQTLGAAGFSRLVAIKRPHTHIISDQHVIAMFMDEARLAARIRHPNVVSTLDLENSENEFFLVMEFIEGDGLNNLFEAAKENNLPIPVPVTLRVIIDILHGLHAAHELRDEGGQILELVHRDVSPHNILIGIDGLARIADFGIVHARHRLSSTRSGELKGKFAYMAPEQLSAGEVDRRTDLFSCGISLWECLTARRLFENTDNISILLHILSKPLPDLHSIRNDLPEAMYQIVSRALSREPNDRFQNAIEFSEALQAVGAQVGLASRPVVGEWVRSLSARHLQRLHNSIYDRPTLDESGYKKLLGRSPALAGNLSAPPPQSQEDHSFVTEELHSFEEEVTPPLVSHPETSMSSYLNFFGLSIPPFSDVRQPELFWDQGPFAQIIRHLKSALESPYQPLFLLGPPGCGKTFTTEMLRYYIPGLCPFSIEAELLFGVSPLQDLCRRFDIFMPDDTSTKKLMELFIEAVLESNKKASLILIVLDGFSPDDPDLLEELLQLMSVAPYMVRLLLTGKSSLPEQLRQQGAENLLSPQMPPMVLRPMNLEEMKAYIRFRFEITSRGTSEIHMPRSVSQFLHVRSQGLPRIVNAFCHNALVLSFLREEYQLSIDTLRLAMKSRNYLTYESANHLLLNNKNI